MKGIFAILALGLMLATAFSGCVGGEKASGTDTTAGTHITGTDVAGNETANQTSGNATENQTLPENYHKEYDDDMVLTDSLVGGWTSHEFPVKQGAKKVVITVSPVCTVPMELPEGGYMDIATYDAKGTALVDGAAATETTYEFKDSDITNFGKWKLEMFPEDPDVKVHSVIDVFYS
ncbi:MAG: hypothetical protein PHH26_03225 [Candidatus Thermoplasmatota archaeon]|nr:hypothetical protein [Candidatus Thermoplasmatota archaeon]